MENGLKTLIKYGLRAVDLSRRNRLLRMPKNAKSIIFEMDLKKFINCFGPLDSFCVEFPHHQILHQDDAIFDNACEKRCKVDIPPTDLQGEQLINRLNSLRLEAKRNYEEHGLSTLFLAIGKVKWKEPSIGSRHSGNAYEEYDYNAPLLLIPICIEELKSPKRTIMSADLEVGDIDVNKVLKLLLEKEYQASPLEFFLDSDKNWLKAYKKLCDQVTEAFSELKIEFKVEHEIQVGQYSFFGQQIYQDLLHNKDLIIKHEFLNALCTHSQLKQASICTNIENPDGMLKVESDFNIMDADRSQLQVIQNVIKGNHLNIQGPPGTGKSQTIVNIIANLLARQQKVLVVCEKQVALQVVLERLKEAGLDKLCLPLFHYNADKKVFAKSIVEDRDSVIKRLEIPGRMNFQAPLNDRTKHIDMLRDYAAALSKVIEPLSKTLYWVHGEFSKHKTVCVHDSVSWRGADPLQISFDEYSYLIDVLDSMNPVFNIAFEKDTDHWKSIGNPHFAPDLVDRINDGLVNLRGAILSIEQMVSDYVYQFASVGSVQAVLKMQYVIDACFPLQNSFIAESDDLYQTINAITYAIDCVEQYNSTASLFSNKYNVPVGWNHGLMNNIDGCISDTVTIKQLKQASMDSSRLKNKLDRIDEIIETIEPQGSEQFDIDELYVCRVVYNINPLIRNVKNWTNRRYLQLAVDQLKVLEKSSDECNEVLRILATWGVAPMNIDYGVALAVAERFEQSYAHKGVFYCLSPQYNKDRKLIKGWCNNVAPIKFCQYLEITRTIANYIRLKNNFAIQLDEFNKLCMQEGCAIEAYCMPMLINCIEHAINLFNEYGLEAVPAKLVPLIQCSKSLSSIEELCIQVKDIYELLGSSWNIFKLDRKYSVKELIRMHSFLQLGIDNYLHLYDCVWSVRKAKREDCLISELKIEAVEIDRLFALLNNVQNLELKRLFKYENVALEVINDIEILRKLLADLKNLAEIVGMDLHVLPKVTVKLALEYASQLKQYLPALLESDKRYKLVLAELNNLLGFDNIAAHGEKLTFADYVKLLDKFNDKVGLENWLIYKRYANKLEEKGHGWFLESTRGKYVANPASLFARSLWSEWLSVYYTKCPALQSFSVKDHERIINKFKKLEQSILQTNVLRILDLYAPRFKWERAFGGEQEKQLLHQSQLKMRHKPIRKVVRENGDQILEYKPCWMMSPLTLSSYVPYGSLNFDVVIFDEASQMRVEHALGAIARAKQVLIFGDENQLPPTSFFEVPNDSEFTDEEMGGDYESILQATKEILPGANYMLSYHYRSKYEELIAFSNHYVYNDRLITFPNPDKFKRAVLLEYVNDGVFDGGSGGSRSNEVEAQRVVEVCVKKVTEEPERSLGVISFSKNQEIAIRDELQKYLKRNPQFQSLLDETNNSRAPFFIKNLESVQGDERDTIILSVGYGRDKRTGEIYNRFGPINSQYGYRRLNVAVTRAKEQVICVSSIRASDIRNTEGSRGAYLLQKYLEYAERGINSLDSSLLVQNQLGIQADSPFEEEVEKALQARGFIIHRQVGVSGFKIDLAIVNPKNEQEYILGIECDGASYHSSYSARMNDRIRQDILERLGWKLYRIWSQHWISHKEDIIEDIIREVC